jgi:hypothetical protein
MGSRVFPPPLLRNHSDAAFPAWLLPSLEKFGGTNDGNVREVRGFLDDPGDDPLPDLRVEPSQEKLQPEAAPVRKTSMVKASAARTNGTAVLEAPAEPRKPEPRKDDTPLPEPIPVGPESEPPLRISVFPKAEPQAAPPPGDPFDSAPPLPSRKSPESRPTVRVDASVVLMPSSPVVRRDLPVSSRPLNAPLILGILATITGVLLPLTIAFEHHRILGILGFCMSGFFVPFAPIAWIAGLSAEKRRREQGLRPERRVVIGRMLGQWGTLLLVAEVTAALILIAGMRLAGSFPSTFWSPQQF